MFLLPLGCVLDRGPVVAHEPACVAPGGSRLENLQQGLAAKRELRISTAVGGGDGMWIGALNRKRRSPTSARARRRGSSARTLRQTARHVARRVAAPDRSCQQSYRSTRRGTTRR